MLAHSFSLLFSSSSPAVRFSHSSVIYSSSVVFSSRIQSFGALIIGLCSRLTTRPTSFTSFVPEFIHSLPTRLRYERGAETCFSSASLPIRLCSAAFHSPHGALFRYFANNPMRPETPNHALQRTAPVCHACCSPQSLPRSRRASPPLSLSLRSLAVAGTSSRLRTP